MNYLAHLYFADSTPDSCTGQLLPDCMPPRAVPADISPELALHIRLHREIDRYTDHHPDTVALRQEFQPPYRRFAGVLIDVVFDQCLARRWEAFHTLPLAEFSQTVYQALAAYQGPENARLKDLRQALVRHQWLPGYATEQGLRRALASLDRRSRFHTPLARADQELARLAHPIADTFERFFPELIRHIEHSRRGISEEAPLVPR